jgi:hypothetical protein
MSEDRLTAVFIVKVPMFIIHSQIQSSDYYNGLDKGRNV